MRYRLLVLLVLPLILTLIYAPTTQTDEPVISVTGVATYAYPGGETTYQIELLNHTDQIVFDGVISMTLPVGFTYVPNSTIVMGEGWPLESREPVINGQTLTWGPYHMPAAGATEHNPYGIHTMMHACHDTFLHLEGAKMLAGNGGYVKQLFYSIDANTTGPSECAVNFVAEAYARNLIPILRLQGHFVNGVWQAPGPGPNGNYAEVAQGFARFVAGLPRRDTNPLYIEVWNEPDLWIEWSGSPHANQYARFLVAVAKAIRQLGDRRIRVINGALTPGNMTFLKQMLSVPGFRDAFDVWASHCYPYNHPPSYNNHHGSARYGTYAIDCYVRELAVLKNYGRPDVKVIVAETGYELGNNTFGFEGYSPINETNRASYMASAFANYWQTWPEVVAVTPFQLSDSSGQWAKFDWVYPYWPYAPHPQFDAVADLPKPGGELQPYGYQVTFRATVDASVEPGAYAGQLGGRERNGNTAFAAEAAPVVVVPPAELHLLHLPVVFGRVRSDGPWYGLAAVSPGAIVPSDFLKTTGPAPPALTTLSESTTTILAGETGSLTLSEPTGLVVIALTDPTSGGRLQVIDRPSGQTTTIIPLDDVPQMVSQDAPGQAQAYVSLDDGLALVDLQAGEVVAQLSGLGRLRGIAYDKLTGRVFVADASHDRLLVLSDDLSQQIAVAPLDHQPDRVILDRATRQLYLSFPAGPQVVALDLDTLQVTAQTSLSGGPILDLVHDAARHRLYALSALAPTYRGITVWRTPTLETVALVAGAGDFPLQTASALTLTPTGHLLVSERTGLWQITPVEFAVSNVYPMASQAPAGGLQVDRQETIYVLDQESDRLRIYQ